jgi:cyclophilin family peptidyl-prolyl cis-trans isomerase
LFSGEGFTALTIRSEYNRTWTDVYGYQPPATAPALVLRPHAIIGQSLEVSGFYPQLRSPGLYRIVWQPYGGLLTSNQLTLDVATMKQAVIHTDQGTMTVEFKYDLAPAHVSNFIELARSGFYNQKTFHRIEPGFFIQGGCPNGDGTGIRLDGKKLDPEFSDFPFHRGTVSMARLESDVSSASCQFIICNTRIPAWDGRYSAFGQLVGDASYETLEKLMQVPVVPETGQPRRPLVIRAVRISDAPQEQAPILPQSGFEQNMRMQLGP